MNHAALLLGAGFIAGAMNAMAGGGSFISFPTMIFVGLPSVTANASNTVALYPGSLASIWAYREDLTSFGAVSLRAMLVVSVIGGFLGAALLLLTPQTTFDAVIPWLLLLATLAFAFGRQAGTALQRAVRIGPRVVLIAQFLLSIYGGYFGGAVGIMMMAVWSLLGTTDLKTLNPAKTLLVAATNTVAVLCFIFAGAVRWPETIAVLLGGVLGGYLGARLARRLPSWVIRTCIICVTVGMTIAFFLRAY